MVVGALFGLAVGSFFTVAVARLPKKESLVAPRSKCTSCDAEILARDNVPVVSWVVLGGRCRSCGERISVMYPILELATAGLFVASALIYGSVWVAVMMALFLGMMPAIALIDWRHRIIPNKLMYPSLVGFPVYLLIARLFGAPVDLVGALLGLLIYGGSLLVIAVIVPAGMGMGDVKLVGVIGLVLGSLGLRYVGVAAGVGILLGGIGAIVAFAAGRGRKATIPFGPFLAAGAVVAGLWGHRLAEGYLNIVT